MTLQELKNQLLNNNTYYQNFTIFKYQDYITIPNEYIERIADIMDLDIKFVDSLNECMPSSSLFGELDNNSLNVLYVDEFNIKDYNLSIDDVLLKCYKTIVLCKKCKDDFLKDYIVEFPKIDRWQVIDYMKTTCKGLNDKKINWLYDISGGNLYRIYNEIKKLSIFDNKMQDILFNEISNEDGFGDLSTNNIFNISNNIMSNNINSLTNVLLDIENIDINSYGLVTLLYNDIKSLLNIKTLSSATYTLLGISVGKFNKLKSDIVRDNNNLYKLNRLVKIFNFLVDYDYKLKTGLLNLNEDELIDYIICSIMTLWKQ